MFNNSMQSCEKIEIGLPIGRYRLQFASDQPIAWKGFAGSAWRGVFGHALKSIVCVTKSPECRQCLLYRACVYPYVFETPPPPMSAKLRKYTAAPHPFLLEIPWKAEPTRRPQLGLTLFGQANHYLAYLIHAFARAAREGLRSAGALELESVEQEDVAGSGRWHPIYRGQGALEALPVKKPPVPPVPADNVRVLLETPLRLRHAEHYVTAEQFEFSDLFRNLLRRISLLTYFHTDTPLEADFAALTACSRAQALLEKDLLWQDWRRYSSRQQTLLGMGGVLGSFVVRGDQLQMLWPFLWLGQWTHAGKGTSMGLGKYRLEVESHVASSSAS